MEFDLSDLFDDESIESIEAKADMQKFMATLSHRDAGILYLWMFDHTQEEIAAEFGLTQRRIGQILQEISKKGELFHRISEDNNFG